MPFLRRLRGRFSRLRLWMPLGFELALTALSFRVAYLLLTDQGIFERNRIAYHWLVAHITEDEWQLGLLALAAASLKAGGLCLTGVRRERLQEVGFWMREAGWGGSFAFWSLLGTTWWSGVPSSLPAGLGVTTAIFSLGMMVTGPAMPGDFGDGR